MVVQAMIWTLRETREFTVPAADPLEFRIEIFEARQAEEGGQRFRLRVWRHETVHLQTLSSVAKGAFFDHGCLVADDTFNGIELDAGSAEEAFTRCRSRILHQCGLSEESP